MRALADALSLGVRLSQGFPSHCKATLSLLLWTSCCSARACLRRCAVPLRLELRVSDQRA
eukprot:1157424-Pelagomonas_calceolata.AAC.9